MLEGVFFVALVAFGGRAGILYSVVAMVLFCTVELLRVMKTRNLDIKQTFMLISAVIVVPIVLFGGLAILLQSSMGERLATHSHWDDSANSRFVALEIFKYMRDFELAFGISSDRILEIAYRMNLTVPLSDIENPWLLMFVNLGYIIFPIWLTGIFIFISKLMRNRPLAIKLAVLAYFVTASTSNSFGRKDSTFLIMTSAVTCAAIALRYRKPEMDLSR